MMVPQNPSLSHYLLSFMFYTLAAIGMMYAVFYYLRNKMQKTPSASVLPDADSATEAAPVTPHLPLGMGTGLEVESVLPLENQQSLYVLRAGRERFLISVSGDKTTLLSKLESAVVDSTPSQSEFPSWYTMPHSSPSIDVVPSPKASAGQRFLRSIQWLVSARSGSNR